MEMNYDVNQISQSGFGIRNFETAVGDVINWQGTSYHINIKGGYQLPPSWWQGVWNELIGN